MGRAHEVRAASMAKTAAAKSKLYSIYAKEILRVAKGNPDPVNNLELRRVVEKAKKEQVPADVINRNIEKAKKGAVENYDVCEYEVFGPAGSNMIIKCLTDNSNRTLSLLKTALNKTKGKLASQGSVSYMYDNLGVVGIEGKGEEEVMDVLFSSDVDVTDIENDNGMLLIYVNPKDHYTMKKALEDAYPGIEFKVDEIGKYAKETVKLEGESVADFEKLYNYIDELDDVSNIYHNVEK